MNFELDVEYEIREIIIYSFFSSSLKNCNFIENSNFEANFLN